MSLRCVFVDGVGTLLRPRQPVGFTYARYARARGLDLDPAAVEARFRAAFANAPGDQEGDGRAFWRPIVAAALDVDDSRLFEEIYLHYAEPRAWWVDLDALQALATLARRGMQLGIISNFDTRLRGLYTRLALDRMFGTLIVSAEVETHKPDPWIFHVACRAAGVAPREAVHIGDDPVRDVEGASRAGLIGLLYDDDLGWSALPDQVLRLGRAPGLYAR